jgi:hypothetical protein
LIRLSLGIDSGDTDGRSPKEVVCIMLLSLDSMT